MKEIPHFKSDIPEHLLADATPQNRYIMENISVLNQKGNWLAENQQKLGTTIDEIKVQTTKTNGSVIALKAQAADAEEVVKFYKTTKKFLSKKWFWISVAIAIVLFFSYVAPWLSANGSYLLPSLFKLFY